MTPIARMLVQELLKPKRSRERWFADDPDWEIMANIATRAHCFDISEVCNDGLTKMVGEKLLEGWQQNKLFDPTLAFLPAPYTWLESFHPLNNPAHPRAGLHAAYCLTDRNDGSATISVITVAKADDQHKGWKLGVLKDDLVLRGEPKFAHPEADKDQFTCYALLSIINSPALFHREVHEPHRAIARQAKTAGIGEVKPWHKIRLAMTRETAAAAGSEGAITGERCLHFVRMFVRWRLGRLEYVTSHWRGNPEKGISLATYRVTP